ncbi:hypothetical protein ACQUJO_21050 [Ralstonia pseudosolanacearum]|uniref:Uncharacterized protein n=1 Tax=Ralstonia solanacearum TaxID=305 RepID=A0AA92ECA7_RALSL|nr:hypothetical protein [Ralstonia pseudosolanacearum]QCX49370.1 hypothetical protein E7Z57_09790 [Ralstonia pseudosolanacearum]
MKLSLDLQKKIQLVLGREILPEECGNVESFSYFSESDVADIRVLEKKSGVLAISYIRYRLQGNVELDRAVSYYGSVIQHGMTVEEWLKG